MEAIEYCNHLFDETTDGIIHFAKLENGKGIRTSKTDLEGLRMVAEGFENEIDVYVGLNTTYNNVRRVKNIRQLRSLFQDMDILKIGFTKEETTYKIYILSILGEIPRPTMVVDSGRGLHLYWRIKNAPYGALYTWQELQDFIYYKLKHLGADKQALDGARVLRLPDTINSKNNSKCKILHMEDIEYSMYELREEYLNYKPKQIQFHETKTVSTKKKVIVNKFFNSYSLHMARIEDIETLCKIRGYDMQGYRNMIIHCYAYWKGIYVRDIYELENEVKELNNSFLEPLKETEVDAILRSIPKAIDKFIEYEQGIRSGKTKRVTKGMRDKAGYWYKNETLIERLGITIEEQRQLKTIIGTEEKYRRNNNRRTPRNENGLTPREQQKQDNINAVRRLYDLGYKQVEIVEKLGLTKGTVSKYLKL